ncbi:MAG: hypothetical protein LBK25_01705 [Treponema sp.]|jgi:hypothetical protein|nr:hypothetical protein [Treponema sp.]
MIPTNDNGIGSWADNLITRCDTNKTAWAIAQDAITTLRSLYDAYKDALAKAQAPDTRSKSATTAKNEAKAALRSALNVFIAKYIDNNDAITVPIREQLGLPIKDTTRTPVPVPTTYPEFFVKVKDIRALDVYFKEMGSASKGRPYGYNGAVIFYGVLDAPPTDPSQLPHSTLATKTPYTLSFTEAERGHRVYIALVWQNRKGEKGPFSQIEDVFIP